MKGDQRRHNKRPHGRKIPPTKRAVLRNSLPFLHGTATALPSSAPQLHPSGLCSSQRDGRDDQSSVKRMTRCDPVTTITGIYRLMPASAKHNYASNVHQLPRVQLIISPPVASSLILIFWFWFWFSGIAGWFVPAS